MRNWAEVRQYAKLPHRRFLRYAECRDGALHITVQQYTRLYNKHVDYHWVRSGDFVLVALQCRVEIHFTASIGHRNCRCRTTCPQEAISPPATASLNHRAHAWFVVTCFVNAEIRILL